MSEHVFFLTMSLVLGTILIIFGMRYVSVVVQAKAQSENGEAYRRLAEKAAAAESEAASALSSIDASLADVRARIAGVEKILKDVE